MIDAKCSLNSLNKILITVSMVVLTIILVFTILYYIYIKQYNIREKYENRIPSSIFKQEKSLYNASSCTFPKMKYPDEMTFRDCQVYFTQNSNQCDEDKAANSDNTCKYTFDGWKEFDSTIDEYNNMISYPKKIYEKNNTVDIINSPLINKCFKPFILNQYPQEFEYKPNELINHDCKGKSRDIQHDTNKFNNMLYTSFNFLNNSTNHETNYNNLISSICSVKYKKLNELINKKFYKFQLNNNNHITALKKCIINDNQDGFIQDNNFATSNFTSISAYGLEYLSGNRFTIFKNTTIPLKNVNIYTFKYNYLCDNSQIMSFTKFSTSIDINNLLNTSTNNINQEYTIDGILNIENIDWNNYKSQSANRIDYKPAIIDKLNNNINNIRTNIDNKYSQRLKSINIKKSRLDGIINKKENILRTYKPAFSEIFNIFPDVRKGVVVNTVIPTFIQENNNETLKKKIDLNKGLQMWKFNGYFNNDVTKIRQMLARGEYNYHIHGVTIFDGLTNATSSTTDGPSLRYVPDVNDTYTLVWSGYFYAHKTGIYTFQTISDDASYIFINSKSLPLTDNGNQHGMQDRISAGIELKKDTLNEIFIIFGENYGGDNFMFSWSCDGSGRQYSANYNNECYLWHTYNGCIHCKSSENKVPYNVNVIPEINNDPDGLFYYYELSDPNIDYELIVNNDTECEILVVGGGGSGGIRHGGGGGAGALIYKGRDNKQRLLAGTYSLKVGLGGKSVPGNTYINGNDGGETYIKMNNNDILLAKGGGGGGTNQSPGRTGGSSGGSGGNNSSIIEPLNNNYGFSGGGGGKCAWVGGGGGGRGSVGLNGCNRYANGGNGGNAVSINITGEDRVFAGGGGGGIAWYLYNIGYGGSYQNIKVGGDGSKGNKPAMNGIDGTGSGGGGSGFIGGYNGASGAGGSGIIILKFNNTINKILTSVSATSATSDIYSITNNDRGYVIIPPNQTDEFSANLLSQKNFTYNLYAYIYLQKGYYKLYGYLYDSNISNYKSVLKIKNTVNKKEKSHKLYSVNYHGSNIITESPEDYVYISSGGFYKIFFNSAGFNNYNDKDELNVTFKLHITYQNNNQGINSVDISTFTEITKYVNGKSLPNKNNIKIGTTNLDNDQNFTKYLYYGFKPNLNMMDIFRDINSFTNNVDANFAGLKKYLENKIDYFDIKRFKVSRNITINDINKIERIKNIMKGYAIDNTNTITIEPQIKAIQNLITTIQNINYATVIGRTSSPTLNDNVDIFSILSPIIVNEEKNKLITIETFDKSLLNPDGKLPSNANRSIYIEEFV